MGERSGPAGFEPLATGSAALPAKVDASAAGLDAQPPDAQPPDAQPPDAAAAPGQPGQPAIVSSDRVPTLVRVIAAIFVAVELAVSGRYGFQQDELYFLVAGHHLAFGYVDQPPLAPLLTRITDLLGVSPTAIRIIPALSGGAIVVMAARIAALFGAGRFGRILAALITACAPIIIGAVHVGNTTPLDLVAWAAVLLFVCTAVLRDRPRWWLAAGAAAGVGLQADNLVVLLLASLAVGLLCSAQRPVLATRWPWLGSALAALIWLPNIIWQAENGWPQLAMSAALHRENNSAGDYAGAVPGQLLYLGLLVIPVVVAGFVVLWRSRDLRFLGITATLVLIYVLVFVPGKIYYADGMAPVILAAGAAATERWIARGHRQRLRQWLPVVASLVGAIVFLPGLLPILPVTAVHKLPATSQQSALGDSVGWPQLTQAVAAQDAALIKAGQRPTSIFAGYYAEAGAFDLYGRGDHLPAVISSQNAYWTWGPGHASDQTVLVVDAMARLRPYFASCRVLTTHQPPFQVVNDWTDIQIGVCTGPSASWQTLWPRLKYYG